MPARQESPVERIIVGMAPLNNAINKVSNKFQTELPKITTNEERSQLKTTIRTYIDSLEG